MIKELNIVITPLQASSEKNIRDYVARMINEDVDDVGIRVLRRSIDARRREVLVNLKVRAYVREEIDGVLHEHIEYGDVSAKPSVIVIGAGPAGLFAALRLIQKGYKPIVLERGKRVDDRKLDLAQIARTQSIDPESNYSFGEGGAGAFSDGKLYTRSKKRGSVEGVLQVLCQHGASLDILVDAHPHIGTDKLPEVIAAIREQILKSGGEVHFGHRVNALVIERQEVKGVVCANGNSFEGKVILATGHSARDVYRLLNEQRILIEPKGIAVGVRLEHPQELIDQIQYHSPQGRGEYLPAAEYSFVTQCADRGVYSFCMCPGGVVVPAASGNEQVVVNGMSASSRSGRWANSGIVVEVRPEDIHMPEVEPTLQMLAFQELLELKAYHEGGSSQVAPAQRMADFIKSKQSASVPKSSYAPGVMPSRIDKWMPSGVATRLQEGLSKMGSMSRGFLTNEALLIGVETRTSSPIRIPRDKESLEHMQIKGLFPCGEGAGYAGGIVSSAIDGERCADAFVTLYGK